MRLRKTHVSMVMSIYNGLHFPIPGCDVPLRFIPCANPVRVVISTNTCVHQRVFFPAEFPLGNPLTINSFVIQQMEEGVDGSLGWASRRFHLLQC